MNKTILKFAMMALALVGISTAMVSCGSDDDSGSKGSDTYTYTISTQTESISPTSKMAEFKSIVDGVVLSKFTESIGASKEVLNAKVKSIAEAANMEAIVKEKALAAGISLYRVSFTVSVIEGGAAKRVQPVDYSISYISTKDADDVVQDYTMTKMNLQLFSFNTEANKDLQAIRDEYASKLTLTFNGKKDAAYAAMKAYLESDATKEFRAALDKHIATYKDAADWYIAFYMKGANNLLSDKYKFGNHEF